MRLKYTYIVGFAFFLLLSTLGFIFITPSSLPWAPVGQLAILVKASPGDKGGAELGFGVDDMTLYTAEGKSVRVTLRTRRVLLNPSTNTLTLLLQTDIPVGEYSAFSFIMKSPELRNEWEEDAPPKQITLVGDKVTMDIQYTVEENKSTALVLSFDTKKSLHTLQNKLLYAPVIQVETRKNTNIIESENNTVIVEGGEIGGIGTFGMDWNGVMRFNYRAKTADHPEYTPPVPTAPASTLNAIEVNLDEVELGEATTTESEKLQDVLSSTTTLYEEVGERL